MINLPNFWAGKVTCYTENYPFYLNIMNIVNVECCVAFQNDLTIKNVMGKQDFICTGFYSPSGRTSYRKILEVSRSRDCVLWWSYRSEIWHTISSDAAEVPVKLQSDRESINMNLAALRLHEILR